MAQQIQFIQLTQSEYDNLSKEAGKLYFTSDTHRIYKGSVLYAATSYDQMTFNEIEASAITVNGSSVSLEGHTHSASDIDGLGAFVSAATQNFSQNGHKHVIADVTNLSGIVSGITNTTVSKSSGSFNALTVGGSNVSVEGHTHSISDVTGLSSALGQIVPIEFMTSSAFDALSVKDSNTIYFVDDNSIYKGDELYGATSFDQLQFSDIEARSITVNGSAVSVEGHSHSIADISDFGNYASASHSHVSADISNFGQAVVSAGTSVFASASHTHGISDITSLSTILTGITSSTIAKDQVTADIGNFRLLSVSGSATFSVNNVSANSVTVNGTSVALDGHSHSSSDISDFCQAVVSAGTSVFASSSHTHDLSEISGAVPIVFMSSSAFDSLSPKNASTIYFVDNNRIYKGSELYAATTFDQLTFNEIEASSITVNGSSVALDGHTHGVSDITGLSSYATQSWVTQQINAAISAVLASQY